jgi:hypothetical protein
LRVLATSLQRESSARRSIGTPQLGFHLTIGNKKYSSWSMRPWFAMRSPDPVRGDGDFAQRPDFRERLSKISDRQGDTVAATCGLGVAAILEYLAEASRPPSCGLSRGRARPARDLQ